jgi:hypothetical protein
VTRLSYGLVRADNVGVGHDERKVTRERHARIRGHDRDLRRRRHLYYLQRTFQPRQPSFSFSFFQRGKKDRRLTLFGKVLTWRDGTNAGKSDVDERRGGKSRQELGDEFCVGEMGCDGCDAQGSIAGGLGINEGAQERKSDGGCEEQHGGRRLGRKKVADRFKVQKTENT